MLSNSGKYCKNSLNSLNSYSVWEQFLDVIVDEIAVRNASRDQNIIELFQGNKMILEPCLECSIERFDLLLHDFLKRLRRNDHRHARFVDIHLFIDRSQLKITFCFVHRVVNVQRHAVSMRVVRFYSIPNAFRLCINENLLIHITILNRFRKKSGDGTAAKL